jgi:hypothetical protein
MKFRDYLESIGACAPARDWVDEKTLTVAWATCEDPGWMLWLLMHVDWQLCVRLCADIAEHVLCCARDLRPICEQAIEAARAWADNPTEANRREAARAVEAAGAKARADARADATADAAAGAAEAWEARADATRAAARSALSAADAAAARQKEIAWQLSHIREVAPTPAIPDVE